MTAIPGRHRRSTAFRLWRRALYLLIIGGAVLYALPFVWMLSASGRSATDINTNPIDFLPRNWQWGNYTAPWENFPFTGFYRNSVFVTVVSVACTLFTGSLVAFAFARMRFRARGFLFSGAPEHDDAAQPGDADPDLRALEQVALRQLARAAHRALVFRRRVHLCL